MITRLNIPGRSSGSLSKAESRSLEDDGVVTTLANPERRRLFIDESSSAFSSSSIRNIILQSGFELISV